MDSADRDSKTTLRIGTRGSDLALWQARHVAALLAARGIDTEIVVIKTRGDRITDVPLAGLEGKGFFTKELEDAQLAGEVDLAVHSLKDMAAEQPPGLVLAALIGRADPRDVLLIRPGAVDDARRDRRDPLPLRAGARVGTSAVRRQAQLRDLRPDLEVAELRGNVPTRVRKLREGQYDAVLIAMAGIQRLQLPLDDLTVVPVPVDVLVPAPGQGMLAVQCPDRDPVRSLLSPLHDAEAGQAVEAERWLLDRLDAGCQIPLGVHIGPHDRTYRLDLFWGEPDGGRPALRFQVSGDDPRRLAAQALETVLAHRERAS